MDATTAAAASIEIRVVPVGGRGPLHAVVQAAAATAFVVSAHRESPRLVATNRVVLVRRATGEVLAAGRPGPAERPALLARMRGELESLPEDAFVARWGDSSAWRALARA